MIHETGDYPKYAEAIREAARRHSVPPELLAVTLWQASQFDPDKIAGKGRHRLGTLGIAGLTLKDCDVLWGGIDRRADPAASIDGAARLLAKKHRLFVSWRNALLAYHTTDEIARKTLREGEPMPIDAAHYIAQARAVANI